MKIYISVDMEGISGINCPDYVSKGSYLYPAGQRLMTEDVNAAVRGAFDAGADEVIVADMHGASGNILVENLDPRALFLAGTPHQPRSAATCSAWCFFLYSINACSLSKIIWLGRSTTTVTASRS